MTVGSSPLARGLHPRAIHHRAQHRIIPARAGFTKSPPTPRRTQPDHPRSRGVYRVVGSWCGMGSRIIPARAGFTAATP